MKDFYDVLDEQEKNLGMAMKAFEDQELKKTYALSVIEASRAAESAKNAINKEYLSFMAGVHDNIGKSPDYSMISKNTQAILKFQSVSSSMKNMFEKRSHTECPSCHRPMSVISFTIHQNISETKWTCKCGKVVSEYKNL